MYGLLLSSMMIIVSSEIKILVLLFLLFKMCCHDGMMASSTNKTKCNITTYVFRWKSQHFQEMVMIVEGKRHINFDN